MLRQRVSVVGFKNVKINYKPLIVRFSSQTSLLDGLITTDQVSWEFLHQFLQQNFLIHQIKKKKVQFNRKIELIFLLFNSLFVFVGN